MHPFQPRGCGKTRAVLTAKWFFKKASPCSISVTELELIKVSGRWVFVLILVEVQILSPG